MNVYTTRERLSLLFLFLFQFLVGFPALASNSNNRHDGPNVGEGEGPRRGEALLAAITSLDCSGRPELCGPCPQISDTPVSLCWDIHKLSRELFSSSSQTPFLLKGFGRLAG